MKVRVKWIENVAFLGETESGHALVMDGAPEGGGRNLGPRPMETVLAGTGGCTAYDVVTILRKARQDISIMCRGRRRAGTGRSGRCSRASTFM
jgi:putative redox protein